MNWFTRETKSFYIARPPEADNKLVYLHPDKSIPRGAKLTVRSDECVLFFREGRYIGRVNAGTVILDTANIPFLGHLLIDRFTDSNQFLCEIFFVSLREINVELPLSPLGEFRDLNSANVVSIRASLFYTLKVFDPVRLIVELGGQNEVSADNAQFIVAGRVLNQMRKVVGRHSQTLPILSLTSNAEAESIAEDLRRLGSDEFAAVGIIIARVYDLLISLDSTSLDLLREFGKQESELQLQAKGMNLATHEGFAEFNLLQGQRAALEGLGKGLSSGNGPMILSGGLGANLTGSGSFVGGRSGSRQSSRGQASGQVRDVLSRRDSFLVKEDRGFTGPYSARQVALLAISKGIELSELTIRSSEDPESMVFQANNEPQIVSEYLRRGGKSSSPANSSPVSSSEPSGLLDVPGFYPAYSAAKADGKVTPEEFVLLVSIVQAGMTKLAKSDCEALVRNRLLQDKIEVSE